MQNNSHSSLQGGKISKICGKNSRRRMGLKTSLIVKAANDIKNEG